MAHIEILPPGTELLPGIRLKRDINNLRNVEASRKDIRDYLNSIERPIPKFLDERFDKTP